jgi:hypothetical protein
MSDNAQEFATEHGLGNIERRVRLSGRLKADGAGELPVDLCLTRTGVWLLAASGRFSGTLVDLASTGQARYETGRLRDRVLIGDQLLSVPPGRGAEVRRCIALGRIRNARPGSEPSRRTPVPDRYMARFDEAVAELVWRELEPADVLIAVARLGREGEMVSALGATVKHSTYFVLSAERSFSVRLSELGDIAVAALRGDALQVTS